MNLLFQPLGNLQRAVVNGLADRWTEPQSFESNSLHPQPRAFLVSGLGGHR